MVDDQVRLTEDEAMAIAREAVDSIGGPRSIYRNPRQAFSAQSRRVVELRNHQVEIRYGEISTPAIATVKGWVFEINDEDIELLMRPPRPRP